MAVRFEGGLAIMPRQEYEALKTLANEVFEDRETARIVDQATREIAEGMPVFPIEVVDRLMNGENSIRVLRKFRGMTQRELASSEAVRITQHYLSDLETGKRRGPLELHQKLARALGVPLGMIAGEAVSEVEPSTVQLADRRKAVGPTGRRRSQR